MSIDFKGFKVFKNDLLPPNTLMVSPDVYEKLTETPEQRQARRDGEAKFFDRYLELLKLQGLSPSGRSPTGEPNYQELPKGPKP